MTLSLATDLEIDNHKVKNYKARTHSQNHHVPAMILGDDVKLNLTQFEVKRKAGEMS